MKEPYEIDAITPDGQPTKRLITVGRYKSQPNNVETSTGEIYYYTSPEQVKPEMSDLVDWYRAAENAREHPIVVAATFHYRFVRIHPFDDGNGRMARLLMNMILIKHGYTVAIMPIQERNRYIDSLEQADKSEDLAEFIAYVAGCCEYTLNLHLRTARGEEIEDAEDIDKEIALFKRTIQSGTGEFFKARAYAENVLYPLFSYCKEKCEQFSGMFEGLFVPPVNSSVRGIDNQILTLPLDKEADAWPEEAVLVSTGFRFLLDHCQAQKGANFLFEIENETDSNRCVWNLKCRDLDCEEKYFGQDLEVLKKIFNGMIRQMMVKLSEIRDEGKGER